MPVHSLIKISDSFPVLKIQQKFEQPPMLKSAKNKSLHLSPVQIFKTQIRKQHRQHLKHIIINQFLSFQRFNLSLTKLCINVHQHLQLIINHNQLHQPQQQNFTLDMQSIAKLISHLNYYLNEIDSYDLQQMFTLQQENRRKNYTNHDLADNLCSFNDKLIITKLRLIIQIYIPHIAEIISKKQCINHHFYNQHHNSSQLQPISNNSLLKGVTNFHQINYQHLLKQCISILCILSSMSSLIKSYSQTSQTHTLQPLSKAINYQPIRLISYQLMQMINPTNTFYQCLIAMGNILHHTIINQSCQQHQYTNNYYYFYQVLCDIQIQEILACLFIPYNQNYQLLLDQISSHQNSFGFELSRAHTPPNDYWLHRHENYQHNHQTHEIPHQNDIDDRQQLLLWFTSIYIKYLYCNQQHTFKNELLIRQIQLYVINSFNYMIGTNTQNLFQSAQQVIQDNETVRYNQYNYRHVKLSEKQCKIIRKLTTIIDYSNISFDNIAIVNTMIPLLRHNWHIPEVAKLWKYLTFKGEYHLPQLISMHDLQVHMFTQKDKETIKHDKLTTFQQQHSENESQVEEQDDQQEQTKTIHNLTTKQNTNYSSIRNLILQILQSIANDEHHKIKVKKDIDLLDGIYNILLQINHSQAKQIWEFVYLNNEKLINQMNQLDHLTDLFEKIQEYIGSVQHLPQ